MIATIVFALPTQGGKPIHPSHKAAEAAIEDIRPVTAREASSALRRMTGLFERVNGSKLGTVGIVPADRPATRTEIVLELDRIFRSASPNFRFTPAPTKYDPALFRIDASQRPALARLVTVGCVAKIGPLAVGPTSGLTPKEFGDALGMFMARLAQMSHLPSPKWTPMLQGD